MLANVKMRQPLLDPSVNMVISQLKNELDECKRQKEDAQNELNAWKFSADR